MCTYINLWDSCSSHQSRVVTKPQTHSERILYCRQRANGSQTIMRLQVLLVAVVILCLAESFAFSVKEQELLKRLEEVLEREDGQTEAGTGDGKDDKGSGDGKTAEGTGDGKGSEDGKTAEGTGDGKGSEDGKTAEGTGDGKGSGDGKTAEGTGDGKDDGSTNAKEDDDGSGGSGDEESDGEGWKLNKLWLTQMELQDLGVKCYMWGNFVKQAWVNAEKAGVLAHVCPHMAKAIETYEKATPAIRKYMDYMFMLHIDRVLTATSCINLIVTYESVLTSTCGATVENVYTEELKRLMMPCFAKFGDEKGVEKEAEKDVEEAVEKGKNAAEEGDSKGDKSGDGKEEKAGDGSGQEAGSGEGEEAGDASKEGAERRRQLAQKLLEFVDLAQYRHLSERRK